LDFEIYLKPMLITAAYQRHVEQQCNTCMEPHPAYINTKTEHPHFLFFHSCSILFHYVFNSLIRYSVEDI